MEKGNGDLMSESEKRKEVMKWRTYFARADGGDFTNTSLYSIVDGGIEYVSDEILVNIDQFFVGGGEFKVGGRDLFHGVTNNSKWVEEFHSL